MSTPLVQATGRRKRAVARVRIRAGSGTITINKRPVEDYFPNATHRMILSEPLRLTETGEVYDMADVAQFAGAYAQGRYGYAIGTASGGDLWLQNGAGVIMHLKAKREGLMLTLGGDAVVISMK